MARTFPILGHPSYRVVHFMAQNGYTIDEVDNVLRSFGINIKRDNLKYRWNAGKDDRRSKPAQLTDEQQTEIRKLARGDSNGKSRSQAALPAPLVDAGSRTIRIDPEVWRALQSRAEPFVETPNDVLRRILGLGKKTS